MNTRKTIAYAFLGLLAACVVVVVLVPAAREGVSRFFAVASFQELQAYAHKLGAWAPCFIILLMASHCVTFLPSEILMAANLILFGPVVGTLYTWLGGMLGAYLAFFLARRFGRPVVQRFVPAHALSSFDAFVEKRGALGLLLLRLIPFVSFNALNYGSGLTRISIWNFTWTTAIGILPFEIMFALVYHSVSSHTTALMTLSAIAVMVLLAAFAATLCKRPRRGR
ncbi:TVP38/TMEM64 family protein [Alicyclobacillus pomorum]|uniref:TVP38/TMEM64 family protein n=1 Tax=Alicyclobacillus pomorum TaxID=204470 RepID=UPI00041C3222|nr:TVP38/TMEM64 family protein [Alicyclobacillus pomorum]